MSNWSETERQTTALVGSVRITPARSNTRSARGRLRVGSATKISSPGLSAASTAKGIQAPPPCTVAALNEEPRAAPIVVPTSNEEVSIAGRSA